MQRHGVGKDDDDEDKDEEVGFVDCSFSYGGCDITAILDAIF